MLVELSVIDEVSGDELPLLLMARTLQFKLLAMLLWAIANLYHIKNKTLL